jgi:hypothetical protein
LYNLLGTFLRNDEYFGCAAKLSPKRRNVPVLCTHTCV